MSKLTNTLKVIANLALLAPIIQPLLDFLTKGITAGPTSYVAKDMVSQAAKLGVTLTAAQATTLTDKAGTALRDYIEGKR